MLEIVGLVRHFPVTRPYFTRQRMDSASFARWQEEYDTLPILPGETDLGNNSWQICYSSDLPRALETARIIYTGTIHPTPALREIRIAPPWQTRLRLPFPFWELVSRVAWGRGRPGVPESRAQTWQRAAEFLDSLEAQPEQRVLVVSHGGIMYHLRQLLLQRGFQGEQYTVAKNGRLYTYSRIA